MIEAIGGIAIGILIRQYAPKAYTLYDNWRSERAFAKILNEKHYGKVH